MKSAAENIFLEDRHRTMEKKYPRIDLAADAVVFGFTPNEELTVLLIKRKNEPFKNCWAVPGGFVEVDENLETAALRELKEETGIEVNHLEQLYAFGDPKRDPRKRVVSIAHYTIVRAAKYQAKANDDAQEVQWFSVKKLPPLAFDHSKILTMAFERLREDLGKRKVAFLKEFNEAEQAQIASQLFSA